MVKGNLGWLRVIREFGEVRVGRKIIGQNFFDKIWNY